MPGRQYSAPTGYRYGFNGKEKDTESPVQYDYGFRIYDPRLVRFKSVDPLTYSYPYYTPYQFAGNMPIAAIDLDGLEQYVVTYYKDQHNTTTKIEVRAYFLNDGSIQDQNVHKMKYQTNNGEENAVPEGGKIAKGNVLVFEVRNEGAKNESISVVDERNKPNSALTKQELGIFNKYKKIEKEEGTAQTLAYPSTGLDNFYQSNDLINSETKTYTATFKIPPPKFDLNLSFKPGTAKINDESKAKKELSTVADYLKQNSNKTITIMPNLLCSIGSGNCGALVKNDGTNAKDDADAYKARGEAIKQILLNLGVPSKQIKLGQGKVINTNTSTVPTNFKID